MSEASHGALADDEISIAQLILKLLAHWRLITAVACTAAILGAIVGATRPYKATVEVRPLDAKTLSVFQPLNDFLIREKLFVVADDGEVPISSKRLTAEFIDTLSSNATFRAAATAARTTALRDKSPEEQNLFLTRFRSQFQVARPTFDEKRNTGSRNWAINVSTGERAADIAFLTDWITLSATETTTGLKQSLLKQAESLDLANRFESQDKQRSLTYQLEDYQKTTAQRLAVLDEQAKIARTLGIAKATIEGTTFTANASVVTNIKSDNPLYLRGYEALEREAKLIRERTDERQFINELTVLEAEIRALKDSPTAARLRELVNQSPLGDASFKLVDIDLEIVQFSRKLGVVTGSLLGLIAGGLLGMVLALVIPAVRKETNAHG
jgi:LPS O-antigen subunit length determinant protein (WzzB/FepE family)